MIFIILVTIGFVILAYLGYTIYEATYGNRSRIEQRIQKYTDEQFPQVTEIPLVEDNSQESKFPTIARFISGSDIADKLLQMTMRAGVKLRPSEIIGIATGLGIILGLLMSVISKNVAGEILGLVVGFSGPFIYLKAMEAQRLTAFNRQIPDALSLLASAIRGGFGFQRALQMIMEELPDPISEEFGRVLDEINVGVGIDTALLNLTTRIRSYDIQLVVTAIIIQQQIGGNLAEIVDNIAQTIRERVKVEGEMAALTAEGKISGVVMLGLPFAMAIILSIANPGFLTPLITTFMGKAMIVGALCLQIIGAIVIKRMVVLDY